MDSNNSGGYNPNPVTTPVQPVNSVPPITPPSQQSPQRAVNNTRRILLGLAVVLLLSIISVVIFFGKRNTPTSRSSSYVFTINGQSIPQADFTATYDYEKQMDGAGFSRDQVLASIKELYVRNYVLKNEYAKQGLSESSLSAQLAAYQYTGQLVNGPNQMRILSAENAIITNDLAAKLGVQVRSGNTLTLGVFQKVTTEQKQQLDSFMMQKLTYYKNLLNVGTKYHQVKNLFQADAQIKSQTLIHADAGSFADMPKSHPFLPGQDFLNQVFNTPMNKASNVFIAASGNTDMYGVVYPTSPLIQGNYTDFRSWLYQQENSLQVKTDFSGFK